jgi:hypothetical protein
MNRLPEWLTEGLIIVLILCLFIVKCGWRDPQNTTPQEPTVVTVHDTVVMVDTIDYPTTVIKWYAKHDTAFIVQFDTIALSDNDCDSVRQSVAYNRDSSVQVTSLTHGRILRQVIESRQVNTTTTITTPPQSFKWALSGGINLGLDMIEPNFAIQVKKDRFALGFNALNRTPVIGYSRELYRK